MHYLFILVSCFLIVLLASCDVAPLSYDIGDGLVLVHSPPQYKTISDNTRCEQLLNALERGVTAAISETKIETVLVQEESVEVRVTPIKYKKNGSVKTAAKVELAIIPSVSKQVSYPAIQTSKGEVRRKSSVRCKPNKRRVIWIPATYKIKDNSGATIKYFETAQALAEYINSR